jgi:hypothetical protein
MNRGMICLLVLPITLLGCGSEKANVASSNQAKPVNQNVATAAPVPNPHAAPLNEQQSKEIDTVAEKREARVILQALRVIEQQGRSMQSLRNADSVESMRKCGDLMRQRMQAARDFIPRAERLRIRGGTFLSVAARDLTNCVTCQKSAIENCDMARKTLREAEKAIK